jgi:hypothetical protein
MGRGSCPPEKVRDFNMDFQKATKRRATIVITKVRIAAGAKIAIAAGVQQY